MKTRFLSLRYLLILSLCVAAAVLWIEPARERGLVETGGDLHVAIVGPGYFRISAADDSSDVRYTRQGELQINEVGELAINVNHELWPIEPRIQVPWSWNRICILPDGAVQIQDASGSTCVGAISLARFTPSRPFAHPTEANSRDDYCGPPIIAAPGPDVGHIQQGWLETTGAIKARSVMQAMAAAVIASIALNALFEIRDLLRRPRP